MCVQCQTAAVRWGPVLPGFVLVHARTGDSGFKKGMWGLLQCNDPDFIWSEEPRPYPGDTSQAREDHWFESAERFERQMMETIGGRPPYLISAYELYNACLEAGFNPKEETDDDWPPRRLEYWLFDRLGRFIRENPFTDDELDEEFKPEGLLVASTEPEVVAHTRVLMAKYGQGRIVYREPEYEE